MKTTMDQRDALELAPYLQSPIDLGRHDLPGKFLTPPHIEFINKELVKCWFTKNGRLAINVPFQCGKALHILTPVPTPDGFRAMIDLEVGDEVFADDGSICHVVAVSPVWEDRPVYSVTTNDGDTIIADAEHEWLVRLEARRPIFKLKTTRQLAERQQRGSTPAPTVMAAGPLQLPDKKFSVDPYVLGVWLGDGTTTSSEITTADREVVEMIAAVEGAPGHIASNGSMALTYRFGRSFRDGARREETLHGRLRALGVLGNKHIPRTYLRASVDQRRALLQGLIDTDGYVSPVGHIQFCNTNKRLACGVAELVASLGGKASMAEGRAMLYGKDCGPKYLVSFFMESAARLKRKAALCRNGIKWRSRYLKFEEVGTADTCCIQVDSPSHMFLCGRSMLPTHNSWTSSIYFPAWILLLWPETRIVLASYEEGYSGTFGARVKDLIEKYGKPLGLSLRRDTKAKNEWRIAGHDGGMVCKGMKGAITGRASDALLFDDTIKDAEQAMSRSLMEKNWDWYWNVAYSRLGPKAPIINVGTRWSKHDLFGKIAAQAKNSFETWRVVKLKAIADEYDVLGRKPGEALWPERQPLDRLLFIKENAGKWFTTSWQQEPEDEEGAHFKPRHWPRWDNLGQAYSLDETVRRSIFFHHDCTRIVAVDWAGSKTGKGKGVNFNCFIAAAITPDARVLILDVYNHRLSMNQSAPMLRDFCRRWEPAWCAVEDDMLSLAKIEECRLYRGVIPEFRELKIASSNKLARAAQAILMADRERIFLPREAQWLADYCAQLTGFTGADDDQDDMADATGVIGRCVHPLEQPTHHPDDYGAVLLEPGKEDPFSRFQ